MPNVWFGALGRDAKYVSIQEGTRLGDLVESEKLPAQVRFSVDRLAAAPDTILRGGEVVVAVPDAIVGEAADSVECAFCSRGPAIAAYWHRAYQKIGTRAIEPEGWSPVCFTCDRAVIGRGIDHLGAIVLSVTLARLIEDYTDNIPKNETRRLNLRLDRMVRGFLSKCTGERIELMPSSHSITFAVVNCAVSDRTQNAMINADGTFVCHFCKQKVRLGETHKRRRRKAGD
jgi:hypothetical protein